MSNIANSLEQMRDADGIPYLMYSNVKYSWLGHEITGDMIKLSHYGSSKLNEYGLVPRYDDVKIKVHKDVEPLLDDLFGKSAKRPSWWNNTMRAKRAVKAAILYGPIDNYFNIYTAMQGIFGPIKALGLTKDVFRFKNVVDDEVMLDMAKHGYLGTTHANWKDVYYDSLGEAVYSGEASLGKRVLYALEELSINKGGLDKTIFTTITNAAAYIYKAKLAEFTDPKNKQVMDVESAKYMAAQIANTVTNIGSATDYGVQTREFAQHFLISRNMLFAKVRMIMAALGYSPRTNVPGIAGQAFRLWGGTSQNWWKRNIAMQGYTPGEQRVIAKSFQKYLLTNFMTYGISLTLMSAMSSKLNTGEFVWPWQRPDKKDWFKIPAGVGPDGMERMIANPLMKEFTDAWQFFKVPYDFWQSDHAVDLVINKSDMTVKSILSLALGQELRSYGGKTFMERGEENGTKRTMAVLNQILVSGGPISPLGFAMDAYQKDPTVWKDPGQIFKEYLLSGDLIPVRSSSGSTPPIGYGRVQTVEDMKDYYNRVKSKRQDALIAKTMDQELVRLIKLKNEKMMSNREWTQEEEFALRKLVSYKYARGGQKAYQKRLGKYQDPYRALLEEMTPAYQRGVARRAAWEQSLA